MTLTIKHPAPCNDPKTWNEAIFGNETHPTIGEIPVGAVVEYNGHVIGGMLCVRWNGQDVIIHPATTIELG